MWIFPKHLKSITWSFSGKISKQRSTLGYITTTFYRTYRKPENTFFFFVDNSNVVPGLALLGMGAVQKYSWLTQAQRVKKGLALGHSYCSRAICRAKNMKQVRLCPTLEPWGFDPWMFGGQKNHLSPIDWAQKNALHRFSAFNRDVRCNNMY